MSKKKVFESFSPEKQKKYEEEAASLWGDKVRQSNQAWSSYSDEQKQAILQEGGAIYQDIAAQMDLGPDSPAIQALLVRWHQNLRYFYEPSLEVLEGLGNLYYDHPEFNATFTAIDPGLPAFLQKAIAVYVDQLETQWLEQELGILKE